jgi:V/A-type H+-transporting ATPase subunit A
VAGVPPTQINAVKSKNELPQIKFIKDYKPELEKIGKAMDAEFNALRSAA